MKKASSLAHIHITKQPQHLVLKKKIAALPPPLDTENHCVTNVRLNTNTAPQTPSSSSHHYNTARPPVIKHNGASAAHNTSTSLNTSASQRQLQGVRKHKPITSNISNLQQTAPLNLGSKSRSRRIATETSEANINENHNYQSVKETQKKQGASTNRSGLKRQSSYSDFKLNQNSVSGVKSQKAKQQIQQLQPTPQPQFTPPVALSVFTDYLILEEPVENQKLERQSLSILGETTAEKYELVGSIVSSLVDSFLEGDKIKISELNRQIQILKIQYQKVTNKSQEKQAQIQSLRSDNMELQKIKSSFQPEMERLKESIELQKQRIAELETQLKQKTERQERQQTDEETPVKRQSSVQGSQSLSATDCQRVAELETKLKFLNAELEQKSQDLSLQQKYCEAYKKELVTLRKQISTYKAQANRAKKQLEQAQNSLALYKEENDIHIETITELRSWNQTLSEEVRQYAQVLNQPEEEKTSQLTQLLRESNAQIFALNSAKSSLEIKLDLIERRHLEQIDRLKKNHVRQLKIWKERSKVAVKKRIAKVVVVDSSQDSVDFNLEEDDDEDKENKIY